MPYPVAHFATFALPEQVADFGGGAVNLMGVNDIFAVLFEYGPESVGRRLFARQGMPRSLTAGDFRPYVLRRGSGRAVGDPVVLHRSRAAVHLLRRARAATPGGARWFPGSTTSSATWPSAPAGPAAVPGPGVHGTGAPMELIGLYLVACILLVVAGDGQGRAPGRHRPRPGRAGRRNRWPGSAAVGPGRFGRRGRRSGAWPSSVPRPGSAWLVALSFAGFAVFVAYARHRGGAISSCGCFGTPDTPATVLHVVVNVGLAVAAAAVASAGTDRDRSSPSWPASPATDCRWWR